MESFEEAPPADPRAGEKIFRTKCAQCHTAEKEAGHKQGPNLHGLSGQKSGTVGGYSCSTANKSMAVTWKELACMIICLKSQKEACTRKIAVAQRRTSLLICTQIPNKSKDGFRLKKPQDRADLIKNLYLKENTVEPRADVVESLKEITAATRRWSYQSSSRLSRAQMSTVKTIRIPF